MADTKISALSALTNTTVATGDELPIVDSSATTTKRITISNLLNPIDSTFKIVGSSDSTKKVAFEVDGLTTGTTRTITVPDASTTMVGTDTTQTLTNKTLSTGTTFNGYNKAVVVTDASGVASALTGTSGQIISFNASNAPEVIANPSAADASTTVKGVLEIATDAEMNAGTGTGGTGAALVLAATSAGAVAANKLVQFTAATKYPAADGSLITNLSTGKVSVITTNTAVTGTGVATDFYSVSIPANTLSTNNGLVGKIYFTLATASTTSKVITMKFGSTTIGTSTMTSDSTGSRTYKGYIDFLLLANAATNAQEGSFMANAFVTDVANNGTAASANLFGSTNGTAAEDSTGALTLAFQITQNSGDTFTALHSTLAKLQ